MAYKWLFILVEGDDDERLFKEIMVPTLAGRYDTVTIWKYAQKTREDIHSLLRSVEAMGACYLYVSDKDQHPCVTSKKDKVETELTEVERDRIAVVVKEIESWYLAGLTTKAFRQFRLHPLATTNNLTKEQFDNMIPKRFDSRIDFMVEVLKCFSVETAEKRNKSFHYFVRKHLL